MLPLFIKRCTCATRVSCATNVHYCNIIIIVFECCALFASLRRESDIRASSVSLLYEVKNVIRMQNKLRDGSSRGVSLFLRERGDRPAAEKFNSSARGWPGSVYECAWRPLISRRCAVTCGRPFKND